VFGAIGQRAARGTSRNSLSLVLVIFRVSNNRHNVILLPYKHFANVKQFAGTLISSIVSYRIVSYYHLGTRVFEFKNK